MDLFDKRSNRVFFAILLGIFVGTLFSSIGLLPLHGEEPRRILVALEMILSNDYLTPRLNGVPYYNKPPLFNWAIAGLFLLFNSFDLSLARLISPICLLLTSLVHFFVVKRYSGSRQIAALSALFYATSMNILFWHSMVAEIDLFFVLITYLQIIFIFIGYQQNRLAKLFLLSYFFAALGTITKGIPSIALQALTLCSMAASERRGRWLFSIWHAAGLLLFGLIVGGYFFIYGLHNDLRPFLATLIEESASHSFVSSGPIQMLYGVFNNIRQLFLLFIPWSVILVIFFQPSLLRKLAKEPLIRFSLYFILLNIPLYLFSPGTRMRYLFVFVPFLSVVTTSLYFRTEAASSRHFFFTITLGIVLLLNALFFAALPFFPNSDVLPNTLHIAIIFVICELSILVLLTCRLLPDILLLALSVLLMRCCYNTVYLPIAAEMDAERSFAKEATEILKRSHGSPIYLYSPAFTLPVAPYIFGTPVLMSEITTPLRLPYQISFALSQKNRQIVRATSEILPNRLYITMHPSLPPNAKVRYSFVDHRTGNRFDLFVIKK